MNPFIGGIQQVGIGVSDVDQAIALYKKALGFNITVFDDEAEAKLMAPYTGNEVHKRRAALVLHPNGGGGFEIWQFTSRTPQPADFPIQLGETRGIMGLSIPCRDITEGSAHIVKCGFTSIGNDWFVDPYGNHFHLCDSTVKEEKNGLFGGVAGIWIGCNDLKESATFYENLLRSNATFDSFHVKEEMIPSAKINHKNAGRSALSEWYGDFFIGLIQTKENKPTALQNRYWGDLGYIHFCLDVVDYKGIEAQLDESNLSFTVDSQDGFPMGKAVGRFAYLEDPDQSLIEWVEVHKLPFVPAIGWYIDFRKRIGKPYSKKRLDKIFKIMS